MTGWVGWVFQLTARQNKNWEAGWQYLPDELAHEIDLDFQKRWVVAVPVWVRTMLVLRFGDQGVVSRDDGLLSVPDHLESEVREQLLDWSVRGRWRIVRRGYFRTVRAEQVWDAVVFS